MTNADKFKHLFGIYATELWAMPEKNFLEWLNADAQDMPTAERKTGKWISNGREDCYECSECHAVIEGDEVYWRNNYFCYHCGADMRKDGD